MGLNHEMHIISFVVNKKSKREIQVSLWSEL